MDDRDMDDREINDRDMDDREAILRVIRAREDAVARGDARGALADHSPDIVVYDLPPPLEYRGDLAAGEQGLNAWFATWKDGVDARVHAPEVMVSGDLAVVFGLLRMQGTKTDGFKVDSWSRLTVVLRRGGAVANGNGGWKIVHEHGSYPMLMDGSNLAATDLKPDT